MELSFGTRELRDFCLEPSPGCFSLSEIGVVRAALEDLASAAVLSDICDLYGVRAIGNELNFRVGESLVLRCRVAADSSPKQVVGDIGFRSPRLGRIQVLSIERNGGGS